MKLEKFAGHALLHETLDRVGPILSAAVKENDGRLNHAGKIRFELKFPAHLLYDSDVCQAALAVSGALVRLEDVRHFLRLMPSAKKFTDLKMSEKRWVEYHFSYYAILLSSVLDLSLLLTNAVLRLGNPERLCKLDNIKNNKHVAGTAVRKAIDNLEKAVKPHKEVRNLFVHRGECPDPSHVSGSAFYDRLAFIGNANSLLIAVGANPFEDPKSINRAFRSEVRQLLSAMEKETHKVTEAAYALFNSLLPHYRRVIEASGKPLG